MSDFEVIALENKQLEIKGPGKCRGQLRPRRLYVLAHGATDHTPSYVWEMEDDNGDYWLAQISDNMLQKGFVNAKFFRKKNEQSRVEEPFCF